MDWSETRKLLLNLARGRRSEADEAVCEFENEHARHGAASSALLRPVEPPGSASGRAGAPVPRLGALRPHRLESTSSGPRAASLCVASGKGGTGKSVVTASLSTLFSARGKSLIIDADLGVGNAHILQDVSPPHSLVDVVEGERGVRDVVVSCSERCDLLAGGSGFPRMASLNDFEMHLIAEGVRELEHEYRFMLVDSAAGVSRQTLAFARACDRTLMVTTPDLTAMTDAYAFVKVLMGKKPDPRPMLLVNRARSEEEAEEVAQRIHRVCHRFLGASPKYIGWLPDDDRMIECVNRRGSVALLEPGAESARALRKVAVVLLEELSRGRASGFGRRLVDVVGYSRGGKPGARAARSEEE